MNYNLNTIPDEGKKKSLFSTLRSLVIYMIEERSTLWRAFFAMVITALLNLVGPYLIGYTIDRYVQTKQYHGVFIFSGILLASYVIALFAGYIRRN